MLARFITLAVAFMLNASAARAELKVPRLTGPVVDQAGVLNSGTRRSLEIGLRALKTSGGSQINVLIIASLDGLPIEQASIKVVEEWKLGRADTDKGVLFLIAPNERKMRIEVGQGLEGDLTDVESKRIIDQAVRPMLRAGDYNGGILLGVYRIAKKTDPKFDLSPYFEGKIRERPAGQRELPGLWVWILAIVILIFFGRSRRFGLLGGGGGWYGGGGGGWGGSSGGGGNWSGGGGGFSGGGASGDW